jgi:hypothetical protein
VVTGVGVADAVVVGADAVVVGVGGFAGAVVVSVTVGLGEADVMTVGEALADGDTVTVGVELGVTGADVIGADVIGVTVAGADVLADTEGVGVEVAGDMVCPEPLVSAMPV